MNIIIIIIQGTGWRQWFRIVCKRIWEVLVFLGDRKAPTEVTHIVTRDLTVHEVILGLDFVEEHKMSDCNMKTLTFPMIAHLCRSSAALLMLLHLCLERLLDW